MFYLKAPFPDQKVLPILLSPTSYQHPIYTAPPKPLLPLREYGELPNALALVF